MPSAVDYYIKALERKGFKKGSAIAIGKSRGVIVQQGKHLGAGPHAHGAKK